MQTDFAPERYQQWCQQIIEDPTNIPHGSEELDELVCQTANAFKAMGVQKGDPLLLYLPMIKETVLALRAAGSISAVPTVIFGGLSAENLHQQIQKTQARLVMTTEEGQYKQILDSALKFPNKVTQVLVVRSPESTAPRNLLRDVDFYALVNRQRKQLTQ